jgi:galactose-1-phosphate uridylyltransferase
MKNTYRSPATQQKYEEWKKMHADTAEPFGDWRSRCVREFEHWILIENLFPFDAIASKSHMLVPRRFFAEYGEMTDAEKKELEQIRKELESDYDLLMENFAAHRSVKNHFHLHFLVANDMPQ